MSQEKTTYVLVEVSDNLSDTNIREDIADLGSSYTVVQTKAVLARVVDDLGLPVIYFPSLAALMPSCKRKPLDT